MKKLTQIFKTTDWFLVFFIFLASLSFFSSLIYFFYSLNLLAIILSFLVSLTVSTYTIIHLNKVRDRKEEQEKKEVKKEKETNTKIIKMRIVKHLSLLLPLIFIALSFRQLLLAGFDKSLISPWQEISSKFFIFYGLSLVSLILFLFQKNNELIKKIYLIIFYFLSFAVCLITYKLGYGFDPFIHQATMEFISNHGFILPKTPYYLGEYGLIIPLSRITGLSIGFLNKIIVPFLAALTFPLLVLRFLSTVDKGGDNKAKYLTIIALLLIPFSPFIVSTPQNLSYVFLIATILLSAISASLFIPCILALATIAIHPLSGLPALGFLLFIFYKKYHGNINTRAVRKIFLTLIIAFNSLILPFSLFLGGGQSIDINNLSRTIKSFFLNILIIDPSKSQHLLLNISNFFAKNIALVIGLLIISSLILFYKKTSKEISSCLKNYFQALVLTIYSLFLSYFLSSLIVFKEVIAYEQSDYSKRIIFLIIIFSLPLIISLINYLIKKILNKGLFTKLTWLLFILILILSNLYNSYPRFDKYHNSRGYNTGLNDLKAVKQIDKQTSNKYIVLANQQVSAAALKVFGFNNYLETDNGEMYFYPIPTGGQLYEYYLKSVYDSPSKENLKQAMDLAQVDESYLIINRYWNRSAELINEAKILSNSYWDIDNEIYIFKYLR